MYGHVKSFKDILKAQIFQQQIGTVIAEAKANGKEYGESYRLWQQSYKNGIFWMTYIFLRA